MKSDGFPRINLPIIDKPVVSDVLSYVGLSIGEPHELLAREVFGVDPELVMAVCIRLVDSVHMANVG